MSIFVDVAFPTSVRKQFTYHISDDLPTKVLPGQRAWVPLRNYFAIGVIVKVHDIKPSFKTKPVKRILDQEPVISFELLWLTQWISKFYFSSWGETIQAVLPAGLNFVSRKYVKAGESMHSFIPAREEMEVIQEIGIGHLSLDEAEKRWHGTRLNKVFKSLLKRKVIEIWEEPDLKVSAATEKIWVWKKGKDAEKARIFLANHVKNKKLKWIQALEKLTEIELPKKNSELNEDSIFTTYSLTKLQKENWIEFHEVEKASESLSIEYDPDSLKKLNVDQEKAVAQIKTALNENTFKNFLLYGITGSGKTEVYIHALKEAIKNGKGGIVLVPEIALTPQTVARFFKIFGDQIAVLHSRLTNRERLQAWNDLQHGKKKIAIGPRSAVFAPVQNPGIFILDEEHDSSYKQMDPSPRYHAREVAIMRAQKNDAVIVMGSATPSMQALYMSAKGKCTLLELNKRHAEAILPDVKVVDLRQYRSAMKGELSIPLYKAIEGALDKKEQVILLYNRRGYASFMQCEDCGYIPQSPECAVSLTYHKRKNLLLCHYSGYSRKADTRCELCNSSNLTIQGSGTQNIEEQLSDFFPKASVQRFDKDSTTRKGSHEKILNAFGKGEADILIGTQLVAKGLDFPNVTVVGVINADTELAFPSFQATERMYQLLSQVAGRSGRGIKPGVVYLQTRQPDNQAIIFAKKHDHQGFSRKEMEFRKPLYYPPYSRLISFVLKSPKEQDVHSAAHVLKDSIFKIIPSLPVLGPSPGTIPWMNKKYIWEVTVKIEPSKGAGYIELLLEKVMCLYNDLTKGKFSTVRINVNVDSIQ